MATLTNNRPTDRILLRIDPARKSEFLRMLKLFDFVEVESLEKQLRRYLKNAPKNVPLTDDDIQAEINAVRGRATSGRATNGRNSRQRAKKQA